MHLLLLANILHFLFAVLHKKDYRFYFVSIARSFLYEYSDEKIFDCVTKKTMQNTEIYQNILLLKERYLLSTPSMLIDAIFTTFEIEDNKNIIIKKKKGMKDITGVVVDAQGEPIIGAAIQEKGTLHGTTTDLDGRFALESFGNKDIQLVVSYIGMRWKTTPKTSTK